jgi:hypothetical protein
VNGGPRQIPPRAPRPEPAPEEKMDHFAIAEQLLRPNSVWTGKEYAPMQATHADQRMASIHSNLAKIHEMKTASLIRYAELLPDPPQYLLREIASRLGVEDPNV